MNQIDQTIKKFGDGEQALTFQRFFHMVRRHWCTAHVATLVQRSFRLYSTSHHDTAQHVPLRHHCTAVMQARNIMSLGTALTALALL